jgi:hypothetical protein
MRDWLAWLMQPTSSSRSTCHEVLLIRAERHGRFKIVYRYLRLRALYRG